MRYVLLDGAWLPEDRLSACEAMDHAYFQQRVAQALQVPADAVITYGHGDCSAEMVQRGHSVVTANICAAASVERTEQTATQAIGPAATRAFAVERSRVLPAGTHRVVALPAMNKEDPNSALLTFFQVSDALPPCVYLTRARLLYSIYMLRRLTLLPLARLRCCCCSGACWVSRLSRSCAPSSSWAISSPCPPPDTEGEQSVFPALLIK
jgi:hypothetical protein